MTNYNNVKYYTKTITGEPVKLDNQVYQIRNDSLVIIDKIVDKPDLIMNTNKQVVCGRLMVNDKVLYCWDDMGKSLDGISDNDLMKRYDGTDESKDGDLKLNVLDHGFVRLVSYMQPAVPTKGWTGDLEVVRNARVSYAAAWRTGENEGADKKLINYLWKNRHSTPFESMTFTFEIKAPIFVFRQWHRHRTWSYNELSARYKELPEEFYIPDPLLIGKQSTTNKQMRLDDELDAKQIDKRTTECRILEKHNKDSFMVYKALMAEGWPRELARSVLPVSTYSHMFATVNLLNLLKFLSLRTHSHAQYEIRVFAEAMMKLITPVVPVCMEAWEATREA